MNEPKPHLNESNREDRRTKKGLKETKVTTYTSKVHLSSCWINHRNFIVKHALLGAILY